MVNCKECASEFESLDSVRRHRSQKHGINAEQTYIDYVLYGVMAECKCGCGGKPTYLGIKAGYRDYIRGHAARVNNNWGHNKESLKKSHETQRKMHKDGTLKMWNDGLTIDDPRVRNNIDKVMSNPNRGNNISKALSGLKKSEEHKESMSKGAIIRWSDPEERETQSIKTIDRLIKNNYRNPKTKLECKFEGILDLIDIDFIYQYRVSTAMFDFYISSHNILIEVDGDFHHCNPNTKHDTPTYPIQIKTVNNDIRKNKVAKNNSYKLLRFWESDINNKPEDVIMKLKKELYL